MIKKTRGIRGLVSALLVLALILTPAIAAAYGGGGSGGTDGFSSIMGTPQPSPWTPTDLAPIFQNLNPVQQTAMINAFTGSTVTKRDLLTIRQVMLEQNSTNANMEAAMLDKCVKALEIMDQLGQVSQTGLSFVPGVGWVTSAALSASRSGADAYRDGKSAGQIAQDMLVDGTASALVGKFSNLNPDKAFTTARAGINMARNAVSQQVRKRAAIVATKALARYGIKKQVESTVEQQLRSAMQAAANAVSVQNRAAVPSFTPDPSFDPMASAPASSVAGGTPQL